MAASPKTPDPGKRDPVYHDPAHARHPDPIWGEDDVLFDIPENGGELPNTCAFPAFGTTVAIQVYGQSAYCRAALERALAQCRAFERRLSTRLPHSDIARLNAAHAEPCPVHADTAALLEQAKGYCRASEGTFDITVQPAMELWDFQRQTVPDTAALARAAAQVDWRGVHVFESQGCWFAQMDNPQAGVDLGGIAKGWIADRLARAIWSPSGEVSGLCVNLGGNVLVRGSKPDGDIWKVGVRDPRHPLRLAATVEARDCAVVTSGTYERCFWRNGRLFHHVLDPKTGMPAETDLASATVIARRAIDAEGFSTALLALGTQRANILARKEERIEQAVLVGNDGTVTLVP